MPALQGTSTATFLRCPLAYTVTRPSTQRRVPLGGEAVTATKNDFTLRDSIPTASLESILCTEELHSRFTRAPDYTRENHAPARLVSALAGSPSTILQTLAETIQAHARCSSAGVRRPKLHHVLSFWEQAWEPLCRQPRIVRGG